MRRVRRTVRQVTGEMIVECQCVKCGETFRCTTYAIRAGRKYCSGKCSDNRNAEATEARREASRAWYRRTMTNGTKIAIS